MNNIKTHLNDLQLYAKAHLNDLQLYAKAHLNAVQAYLEKFFENLPKTASSTNSPPSLSKREIRNQEKTINDACELTHWLFHCFVLKQEWFDYIKNQTLCLIQSREAPSENPTTNVNISKTIEIVSKKKDLPADQITSTIEILHMLAVEDPQNLGFRIYESEDNQLITIQSIVVEKEFNKNHFKLLLEVINKMPLSWIKFLFINTTLEHAPREIKQDPNSISYLLKMIESFCAYDNERVVVDLLDQMLELDLQSKHFEKIAQILAKKNKITDPWHAARLIDIAKKISNKNSNIIRDNRITQSIIHNSSWEKMLNLALTLNMHTLQQAIQVVFANNQKSENAYHLFEIIRGDNSLQLSCEQIGMFIRTFTGSYKVKALICLLPYMNKLEDQSFKKYAQFILNWINHLSCSRYCSAIAKLFEAKEACRFLLNLSAEDLYAIVNTATLPKGGGADVIIKNWHSILNLSSITDKNRKLVVSYMIKKLLTISLNSSEYPSSEYLIAMLATLLMKETLDNEQADLVQKQISKSYSNYSLHLENNLAAILRTPKR